MGSILDRLTPIPLATPEQIARHNAAVIRRFHEKVMDECWRNYRAYVLQGRTKPLGEVFEQLIRINIVRVKRRRGKPPLLVWLR